MMTDSLAGTAAPWPESVPVLIVGAGPVGLMSALLLARQGVDSVLVERWPTRLTAPKAHALNPRTLEICRALGLARETLAARATRLEDSRLVRFMTRLGGAELASLPYERQDDGALDHTPTPLLNIAQPDLEDILGQLVAREPRIRLLRGCRWLGFEASEGGVASTLEMNAATTTTTRLQSRYVVAADGAESAVRKFLGIGMVGPEKLQHRLMIHFRANLRPLLRDHPGVIYWNMDPRAPGGFIAFDIDCNFVYMYRYDPALVDPRSFSVEECEGFVRAAIEGDAGEIEILNRSPWTLSVQLAERYRGGPGERVFLVGDAAHRFPPMGGLGLNTGVQDAHNLAWKLAAVLGGRADAALLGSYEAERRPIADINAAQSHVNVKGMAEVFAEVGRLDALPGGLAAQLGHPAVQASLQALIDRQMPHFDSFGLQLGFSYGPARDWVADVSTYRPSTEPGVRMPHAWVSVPGGRPGVSLLDLLSPTGFSLIAGPSGAAWAGWAERMTGQHGTPVTCLRWTVDFDDLGGRLAADSRLTPTGAVLVRPDGHVVRRVDDDSEASAARLEGALQAALGRVPVAAPG